MTRYSTTPAERVFPSYTIFEGTSEIQRVIIADQLRKRGVGLAQ